MKAIRRQARAFAADTRGVIAIMTALLLVPLLLLGGGVLDLANAYRLESKAQDAADAAILATLREPDLSQDELLERARAFYAANSGLDAKSMALTQVGDEFTLDVELTYETIFLRLISIDQISLAIESASERTKRFLDIVLVLDNSGSMDRSSNDRREDRIGKLREAVDDFVGQFAPNDDRLVRIALVPFSDRVRLASADRGGTSFTAVPNPQTVGDCQTLADADDRKLCRHDNVRLDFTCSDLKNATDRQFCTQDTAGFYYRPPDFFGYYTGSLRRNGIFFSYYQARVDNGRFEVIRWLCASASLRSCYGGQRLYEEPAPVPANPTAASLGVDGWQWDGCVIDRSQPHDVSASPARDAQTRYPKAECVAGRRSALQTIVPLTDDLDAVRRDVRMMEAEGGTNITLGLQWAMEALSDEAPLRPAAREAGKVIVLLTDGENSRNRWIGSGNADSNPDWVTSELNERTRLACANAREATDLFFTINLVDGDSDLIRDCAGDPANFVDLNEIDSLQPAFSKIANAISPLRLTR